MLMIRLARVGARKQPHYRIVVIEKDRARNGRSIEVVGTYNPRTEPATVLLKQDRIAYWTGNGAQTSDTVARLISRYKPAGEAEAASPAETATPVQAEPAATSPTPAAAEPVEPQGVQS